MYESKEEVVEDKSPVLLEDLGNRFLKEGSKRRRRYGLYQCGYCGNTFEARIDHINGGNNKSCGCQKTVHSLANNKFYTIWKDMRGRCHNTNYKSYKDYGKRGISVCEEWQDIKNFIEWAEATYIEGLSLDRIDNDGNYEPNNCRWTDKTTQVLNRRISSINTSGFVGIGWCARNNKWVAKITVDGVLIYLGSFIDKQDAVKVRDSYIINNKLPHKLSVDY